MEPKTSRISVNPVIEIAAAGICLGLGVSIAQSAWLNQRGVWGAHEQLIYALGTPVPAWEYWNYEGTRTQAYAASPLSAWLITGLWTGAVWLAGFSIHRIARPLWLLAILAGAVAAIGFGDPFMPLAMMISVGMSVLVFRKAEGMRTKPAWTALTLGLLSIIGFAVSWPHSWADGDVSHGAPFTQTGAALIIGIALHLISRGGSVMRHGKWIGLVAATTAALLIYPDSMPIAGQSVWKARAGEIQKLTEDRAWADLRRDLKKYRPTEAAAAEARLGRPEAGTAWSMTADLATRATSLGSDGVMLADWLLSDRALFGTTASVLPEQRPADSEMAGWWLLSKTDFTHSKAYFAQSIVRHPNAPMLRYGLGLAELGEGNHAVGVRTLARFCLMEPRAIFSPAWKRTPLREVRTQVLKEWLLQADRLLSEKRLNRDDAVRLERFVAWARRWEQVGGEVEKFLTVAQPLPVAHASVALYRERLLDTLKHPTDAKVGAIISCGVALFTDRHVNLGQAKKIFEVMRTPGAEVTPDAVLKSRPPMAGWESTCRITEGGAGATLHDFEENLIVRMITYGWESGVIVLPEDWR